MTLMGLLVDWAAAKKESVSWMICQCKLPKLNSKREKRLAKEKNRIFRTMESHKWYNVHIRGISEGKRDKGTEKTIEAMMMDFLKINVRQQTIDQKLQRLSRRINAQTSTPMDMISNEEIQRQRCLKAARGGLRIHY